MGEKDKEREKMTIHRKHPAKHYTGLPTDQFVWK